MSSKNKKLGDNIKFILKYIIPTILILILIWSYIKVDLNSNSDNSNLELGILENLKKEFTVFIQEEKNDYKVFTNSFFKYIPFNGIEKSKEINYVKALKDKCLETEIMSENEILVLRSYSRFLDIKIGVLSSYGTTLPKNLGVIASIFLFVLIIVLLKKIKNSNVRSLTRYYLILFFMINYFGNEYYSNSLEALEGSLKKCKDDSIQANKDSNNSVISNFSKSKINSKTDKQKDEIDSTWQRVHIRESGTIYLPPTLEIQDGIYKKANESFKTEMGFELSDLIAQNKGTNNFNGTDKYARVIFNTTKGVKNDFENLDFDITKYSKEEIEGIGNDFKKMITKQFQTNNKNIANIFKLITWHKPDLEKVNKASCLHLHYERQLGDNPIVTVNSYVFFNNDRIHKLTLAYRQNQAEYWQEDFKKIVSSLEIMKK